MRFFSRSLSYTFARHGVKKLQCAHAASITASIDECVPAQQGILPLDAFMIVETTTLKVQAVAAQGELDELEREEFFRLKKVQANKRKVADELTKRVRPASRHCLCTSDVRGRPCEAMRQKLASNCC